MPPAAAPSSSPWRWPRWRARPPWLRLGALREVHLGSLRPSAPEPGARTGRRAAGDWLRAEGAMTAPQPEPPVVSREAPPVRGSRRASFSAAALERALASWRGIAALYL